MMVTLLRTVLPSALLGALVLTLQGCGNGDEPDSTAGPDSQNSSARSSQPPPDASTTPGESSQASIAAAFDVTEPTFTKELMDGLGVDSTEFAERLAEELASEELSSSEVTELLDTLALDLIGDSTPTQSFSTLTTEEAKAEAVINQLVRRLGKDATSAETPAQLIQIFKERIDPTGEITNTGQFIAAVNEWAENTSGTVLRITSPDGASGAFASLAAMSFDDVAGSLNESLGSANIIEVPLPGVPTLDDIGIPGVDVSIDVDGQKVSFSGTASVFNQEADVLLTVIWRSALRPDTVLGIRVKDWSLNDVGFRGPLSEHQFGDALFVITGSALSIKSGELDPVAGKFFAEAYGDSDFTLELEKGVNMVAIIPVSALPESALRAIGFASPNDEVTIEGLLGLTFGILSGDSSTGLSSLSLKAQLPPASPQNFPDWLRSSSDAGWTLALTYESSSTSLSIANDKLVAQLDGRPRPFAVSLDVTSAGGQTNVAFRGRMLEAWERPFGVQWLALDDVTLELSADTASGVEANLASSLRIGDSSARLTIEIRGVGRSRSAIFTAQAEQVSTGDVIALLRHSGLSVMDETLPELTLSDLILRFESGDATKFTISANSEFLNAEASVLFSVIRRGSGDTELLAGFQMDEWSLSNLGIDGTVSEYAFPRVSFTIAQLIPGSTLSVPSDDLSPAARDFYASVYDTPDFMLELRTGITMAAILPLSVLPDVVLQTLGIDDPNAKAALEGFIGLDLGLGADRRSAKLTGLELKAELPSITPIGLPKWLRSAPDSRWNLKFGYEKDAVTFAISGALEADLDGASRKFEVSMDLNSAGGEATASIKGAMIGPWNMPFGVEWMSLDDVTLEIVTDSQAGLSASLGSSFDISGKTFALKFDISTGGAQGTTATITGTTKERFSTNDVVRLVSNQMGVPVPEGTLPELALRDVVMTLVAGREAGFALAGTATALGRDADVLFAVMQAKGGGRPQIVAGVQVTDFSIGSAVPALAGTIVDDMTIPAAALVATNGDGRFASADLIPPVGRFYESVYGTDDFTLDLKPGLSLVGSIPMAGNPLNEPLDTLGMGVDSLLLTGTLPGSILGLGGGGGAGFDLDNLALSAALPPMRPPGSPEWFRSGQLSFSITGSPSVGLVGEITVVINDEVLTFMTGADIAKVGPKVTISIFGVLESEEPWVGPFGVDWLVLNRVALQLSLDAALNIGLGFSGDAVIGEKDIQVAVSVAINAATGVPSLTILQGKSEAGVSMSDIISVQQSIASAASPNAPPPAISLAQLPEMALKVIELKFALVDNPILGIERGFKIKGDLYLPTGAGGSLDKFAFIDIDISDRGIIALGGLDAYEIGPLAWDDIDLDLTLTLPEQKFMFTGGLELFGVRQRTAIDINTDSILFAGQGALDQIDAILTAWEVFSDDPVASFQQLPTVFALVGFEEPVWVGDIVNTLALVTPVFEEVQSQGGLLDLALGGVDVPAIPATTGTAGAVTDAVPAVCLGTWQGSDCWTTLPVEATVSIPGIPGVITPEVPAVCLGSWQGSDCWTTLPVEATVSIPGVPGVITPAVPAICLGTWQGSNCWTTLPVAATSGYWFGFVWIPGTPAIPGIPGVITPAVPALCTGTWSGSDCWLTLPIEAGAAIPGIPGVITPAIPEICAGIWIGDACWTTLPLDAVAAIPGVPGIITPEIPAICAGIWIGDDCWLLPPTPPVQAGHIPGVCELIPEISCSKDDLIAKNIVPILTEHLISRLNRWIF